MNVQVQKDNESNRFFFFRKASLFVKNLISDFIGYPKGGIGLLLLQ